MEGLFSPHTLFERLSALTSHLDALEKTIVSSVKTCWSSPVMMGPSEQSEEKVLVPPEEKKPEDPFLIFPVFIIPIDI